MPTVFARLLHYQKTYKKSKLNLEQKQKLGDQICQQYQSQDLIKLPLQRVLQIEPEGSFQALSYPHKFKPEIDRIIDEFYKSIPPPPPPPKKRKRIPVSPHIYSVKPTGQPTGQV